MRTSDNQGSGKEMEPEYTEEVFLYRETLETPAWRALPSTAASLYPWLVLQWTGLKENNYGQIRLSIRRAALFIGSDVKTAARGFHHLQATGLLHLLNTAVWANGDALLLLHTS